MMCKWKFRQSGRRTDIVASGLSLGGSIAIDIPCCAVNRTPPLPDHHGKEGFDICRLELEKIIEARVSKKMKENLGLNYRGTFLPFVITVGGTINSDAWQMLERSKKYEHKGFFLLLLNISCILAKSRAMMFTNSNLAK